jgi:hypothetical protein
MSEEPQLHEELQDWIPAERRPDPGQLIVCYFAKTRSYWAGRYIGVKQSFDRWMPLQEPGPK